MARRRPWKLARETTTLDRLSGGRLIFGAGLGSQGGAAVEWEDFGEEPELKVRAEMLDEGLAILDGLWSGQAFSHLGSKARHYSVSETRVAPTPLQKPPQPPQDRRSGARCQRANRDAMRDDGHGH